MWSVPALSITDGERVELERLVRAHTTPQRTVKRAKVVLLAAEGVPNRQISAQVGMSEAWIVDYDRTAKPFAWTYNAEPLKVA